MDGNKDAALKCLDIGKQALEAGDRDRALKFLSKARRLDPGLAGVVNLLSEIQRDSGDQSDLPTSEVTDEVSSKPADQSSVRRRGPANGSSSASVAYTEEQVLIVRKIKKKRDYYEILEVEKTCTVEDIRKAYRKLSLKVHPDKNKAPGAEEAFKAVSKAFQCLSNEENRKKYDVVGSDEPVFATRPTRHRSQGFSGFYEGDVDAEEIFRNFFFGGGMQPSTQFCGFTFGNGMRPRAEANPNSGEFNYGVLLQLLPVLLVLFLSFLPSSDPVYALYQSHPYQYKLATPKGVPFYVKPTKFEQEYPPNTPNRVLLEKHIEGEYFSVLRKNCRLEMQRRQWGFTTEMTHCDMLKRFDNVA